MILRLRWLYPVLLRLAGGGQAFEQIRSGVGGTLSRWGPLALALRYVTGVSLAYRRTPLGRQLFWLFVMRTSVLLLVFGVFFGLFLLSISRALALLALGTTALIAPAVLIILRYASSAEIWQPLSTGLPVGARTHEDARVGD